jgi:hypothetical protein
MWIRFNKVLSSWMRDVLVIKFLLSSYQDLRKKSLMYVQAVQPLEFRKRTHTNKGQLWSYGSLIYNYLNNQCLSSLMLWVRISVRVRCTTLCDNVCQWLATGQWFSPGSLVSSTNKTDHHDCTSCSAIRV